MSRNYVVIILVGLGIIFGVATAAVAEPATYEWKSIDKESIALVGPHGTVWRLNYASSQTQPYFDPVGLVTGESLTWNQPPDHAWHHALWFSWYTIDGVNYWEHDPETGRPRGITTWKPPTITTGEAGSARIEMQLTYAPMGGDPVLVEDRVVEISSPDGSGRYHFDWDSTFRTTNHDALLDRIPIPPHPQGVAWGGFAGLSIRLAEKLEKRKLVTDHSAANFENEGVHRLNALACDYQGVINGQPAGIAIFQHLENPRARSAFYVIGTNMSYLNPAFLQDDDYTVTVDQPLRLRYRIEVHPDHWTSSQQQELVKAYHQEQVNKALPAKD